MDAGVIPVFTFSVPAVQPVDEHLGDEEAADVLVAFASQDAGGDPAQVFFEYGYAQEEGDAHAHARRRVSDPWLGSPERPVDSQDSAMGLD